MSSEEKFKKILEILTKGMVWENDTFLTMNLAEIVSGEGWRFFEERGIWNFAAELLRVLKSEEASKIKKIGSYSIFLTKNLIPAVEEYFKAGYCWGESDFLQKEFLCPNKSYRPSNRPLNALNNLLLIRKEWFGTINTMAAAKQARQKRSKEELNNIAKKIDITEIKEYFEKYSKEFVANELENLSEVEKLLHLIDCGGKFLGTEKKILTRLKKQIDDLKNFDNLKPSLVVTNTEEVKNLEEKIKSLEKENLEIQELTKKRIADRESEILAEHWKEKMRWGNQIGKMERSKRQEMRDKDNQHEEEKINLFRIYLHNLAEVDGRLIDRQKKLKKLRQEGNKYKKINHLQYQEKSRIIKDLKNQIQFLIKRGLELSDENEKLKIEIGEGALKELRTQLDWSRRKFPGIFTELETRVGAENITMDNFVQFLLHKEQKAENEKLEIERQKNGQVKKKERIEKKLAKRTRRVKKISNIHKDLTEKYIDLQSKITRTEHDLGIGLDNLTAELEGKTFVEYKQTQERERKREKERDDFESQLTSIQLEADNYKQQLEKQKDYEEVKQERNQLKTELNQKETSIIAKINSELKLDLGKEINLEQAIEKIKELIINKSPGNSQVTDLDSLRRQVVEKDEKIKWLEQEIEKNSGFSGPQENYDKLNSLLAKIQSKNDEADTKDLEEINQLFGTAEYEKQKQKIRELEIKVAQKNFEKYQELVKTKLDKELTKWELKGDELTPEIKNEVEKLKEDKANSIEKTVKISNKTIKDISLAGASKKINSLINQGDQLLHNTENQAKTKVDEMITIIKEFISADNIFQQKVYQLHKPQIEQLLKNLESFSTQMSAPKSHSPLIPILVTVPLLVFLMVLVIIIVRNRRIRKRE